METAGKKIVMTGATGFIGRHVAGLLLEQGVQVYALVRPDSLHKDLLLDHENLHQIEGTLSSAGACLKAVGPADGFFHFAWGGVNREEIDSPAVQRGPSRVDCFHTGAGTAAGAHGLFKRLPSSLEFYGDFGCGPGGGGVVPSQ